MLVSLPLSLRFASSKSRERGWNKRTDEIKLEIYVYPYRYIGVDIYKCSKGKTGIVSFWFKYWSTCREIYKEVILNFVIETNNFISLVIGLEKKNRKRLNSIAERWPSNIMSTVPLITLIRPAACESFSSRWLGSLLLNKSSRVRSRRRSESRMRKRSSTCSDCTSVSGSLIGNSIQRILSMLDSTFSTVQKMFVVVP